EGVRWSEVGTCLGGGKRINESCERGGRAVWGKSAREVITGLDQVPPQRDLLTGLNPHMFEGEVSWLMYQDDPIAFDIETNPAEGRILCISFACEAGRAVSVPWSKGYKEGTRTILTGRHPKIAQHGHYDCYWLAQEGFAVKNWE